MTDTTPLTDEDDTIVLPPHATAAEAAEYAAQVHAELARLAADQVELNAAALIGKHFHNHRPDADWFRVVPSHDGPPTQIQVARNLTPRERVARPRGEPSPPFVANGVIELDANEPERRHLAHLAAGMTARGEAHHASHRYGLTIGAQRHAWVQVALSLAHWETFTGSE